MSCVTNLCLQTTPPAKAILACLAILLDVRAISGPYVDGLVTSV